MQKIKKENRAARATALEEWQEKYPLPDKAEFQVKQFMVDENAFEALMDSIAEGNSVRHFCMQLGMPTGAIVKMNRFLAKLKAPDPRYDTYMAAKGARAHHHADSMLRIIEDVQEGLLTTQQGVAMLKGLQWLAERMDPVTFSGRLQIDANLKIDTASAHLEAVRAMATMIKHDEPGVVIQGQVLEVETPDDEDPYGLLE
jgi:hypothetical protein